MTATIVCRRCGATNRVDFERAGSDLQPVCGRCKAVLSGPSEVVDVDESRFQEQVLESPLPVLLDVWATWCAPCRGLAPIIEEIAASSSGRLRVARLDVDKNPEATSRLGIQGVPTLILFKNGREVTRMIGARGKGEILGALAAVV